MSMTMRMIGQLQWAGFRLKSDLIRLNPTFEFCYFQKWAARAAAVFRLLWIPGLGNTRGRTSAWAERRPRERRQCH